MAEFNFKETDIWCHAISQQRNKLEIIVIELETKCCNSREIEQEFADNEIDGSEEERMSSRMRLSWALVHFKLPADVNRGIAMLQDLSVSLFKMSTYVKLEIFLKRGEVV